MDNRRQYRRSVFNWQPGSLARHGGWLLFWMLLRAGFQTASVLLLARMLGAVNYGKVVALISVASFLVPFSGLGLSLMVLRNAARDPDHESVYLARAVFWWKCTLLPCIVVAIVVAAIILPVDLPIIAVSGTIAAEITATSITELRARHLQAQQKTRAFGALNASLPLFRFVALGLLFLSAKNVGVTAVLWIYTGSGLLYALLLWLATSSEAGDANEPTSEPMTVRSGLPFSLATFAAKLQAEFNKPVLAQSNFGLAGSYNVAQRAIDMASLPLQALQEVLWPRLHAHPNPLQQLRHTGLILLLLAIALGCALWLFAPLFVWLTGPDYKNVIKTLRLLALLPALQVLRALLNFHVIHYKRITLIGWTSTLSAIISVLGVLALVPTLGMLGAVITSYAAEILAIVYLLIANRSLAQNNT